MDLHGVEGGFAKRGTQKRLYDLIKSSDRFISF